MNSHPSEKITINANTTDLGKIDLLVEEGFYATRTEFIKTSMKLLLDKHEEETRHIMKTKLVSEYVVGLLVITKSDLEALKKCHQMKKIEVVGLLIIDKDITLELAKETISSITSYGVCRCAKEIKAYYNI